MKTCIVLDANIWIRHYLLRTPISSALIYGIVQKGDVLGVPKVVLSEILFHTERRGFEILDGALKDIRLLNYFYEGAKSAINSLPDKDKISKALPIRIAEIIDIILQHKHTPEEMERALEMVLQKLPPSDQNRQQYKDSLLWQAVLSFADEYKVCFVTEDYGFFKDKKFEKGPADNIREDIESKKNDITIYADLASCAKDLYPFEKPIDNQAIIENIFIALVDGLKKESRERGYVLENWESGDLKSLITSDPSKIAVKFKIECNISEREDYKPLWSLPPDLFPEIRGHHKPEDTQKSYLNFEGHCLVSIENNEISNLDVTGKHWWGKWGYTGDSRIITSKWPTIGPKIYGDIHWPR